MSDERQMPLEKPSEPVVDMAMAVRTAERKRTWTYSSPDGHGDLDHESGNLARAFLQLRAEVEALTKRAERAEQHVLDLIEGERNLGARAEASEARRAALESELRRWCIRSTNGFEECLVCNRIAGASDSVVPHSEQCPLHIDAALAPPAQDASEKEAG